MSVNSPFDLLHSEIVEYFSNQEKESLSDDSENGDYEFDKVDDHFEHIAIFVVIYAQLNAATKLEMLGFRVGYSLVERVSKDSPRLITELDFMKFLCKEFWSIVFRKQVDNLKTNHQGVYVVQDSNFMLLTHLSSGVQYLNSSPKYLGFSCGLLRGALQNLGISSVVTATVEVMPQVKFNVHIQQKSP